MNLTLYLAYSQEFSPIISQTFFNLVMIAACMFGNFNFTGNSYDPFLLMKKLIHDHLKILNISFKSTYQILASFS